jgi:succinoglycan biosynthesis transport protein ExoP
LNELGAQRTDLRRYLRQVWRRRWLLVAILIGIPFAVFVLSSIVSSTYEARTTLQAQDPASSSLAADLGSLGGTASPGVPPTPAPKDLVQLTESTEVARKAARELGDPPNEGAELLDMVSAEAVIDEQSETFLAPAPETVAITARADSATRAADVANAFAIAAADIRTQDAVKGIDETIAGLLSEPGGGSASATGATGAPRDTALLDVQVQQLRALRASLARSTEIVSRATPPAAPVSPRPLRNAAVGFVLAALLSAGIILLLNRFDRRVQEPEELEGLIGAPLLATIPKGAFPGRPTSPQVKEAFRTLRSSLTYFNPDRPLSSVIITSPGRGDGKTTVATNLAIALARAEGDVILIDADLRRSPVATFLGATGEDGLDSVLRGERRLDDALRKVDAGGGRLRILSGGSPPPDPGVLLGSDRMKSALGEATEQVDVVVIDTPAALVVSDVIPLLAQASGVLLVARINHTNRDHLVRATRMIDSARGSVVGVVATGARLPAGYGYVDGR